MKNNKWIIISGKEKLLDKSGLNRLIQGSGFSFYSNSEVLQQKIKNKNWFVYIEGNIMPRTKQDHITHENIEEKIINEYILHGDEFINKFKGNYILIIGNEECFNVFSDHLGIKKFFFHSDNKDFSLVSNDISLIRKAINAPIDKENIAIYSLTNRFPGGITIFKDIYYSQPATHLSFKENEVKIKQYWTAEELFYSKKEKSTYSEFANKIKNVIKQHIDFFKPNELSVTLTGGSDSRIILGTLLSYGYKPKTFTFGHPESGDVSVAKSLAKTLGLIHNNYNEQEPTSGWFGQLTKRILENGNSLINYHRAYRLDGILKEKQKNPDSKMTIVGHAGGEPIRGLFYDNLIVTDFIKNYLAGDKQNKEKVVYELKNRYINEVNIDKVVSLLDDLPYCKTKGKKREFLLIFNLLITNHLYQDLNLYDKFHHRIFVPFTDIDYLEYLFSSQYSMLYKNNTSKNKLNRLNIPALHCNTIKEIYPELLRHRLNKGYSPAEYLNNKYLCAIKKEIRKHFNKETESNFKYGRWYKDFLEKKWPRKSSEWLSKMFDLRSAEEDLRRENIGSTESSLIKYTSIIMLHEFSNFY